MQFPFHKYQATGNDFVILDNRNGRYAFTQEQVAFLCHRRFGVGADGLMLLNSHPTYDFEMKYYNADGREGSMCGNGGRALVKFAADQGIVKSEYRFLAVDGEHLAEIETDGRVALKMIDVETIESDFNVHVLNTGSPQYVQATTNVEAMDVVSRGREVRYSDEFKHEGINVNFIQETDEPHTILVRTYERGVEDETFSCGTGTTASALVSYHNESGFNQVNVITKGGRLSVEYEKRDDRFENIWLIGPAEKVFEGSLTLPKVLPVSSGENTLVTAA